MDALVKEIDANFDSFFDEVQVNLEQVIKSNNSEKEQFKLSYRRLVSYQAWMSEVLEKIACDESLSFFKEAQNDALMSHALARQGAWRVALMSLRSCIENTVFGLYYLQHPVELELWVEGKHKLGFTETINYLLKHPKIVSTDASINGVELLKAEYSTLSKAVHGSSKLFRMTKTGKIEGLNIVSPVDFGGWKKREFAVLNSLNLVLLSFFREELVGAANVNLRKAISIAINPSKFDLIKEKYKVNLIK
ncbi:TPA: hypothetical protein VGT13_003970 [Shewanella algae]|uniref:hypothetical protein n=1 Tax=Shewanella algae TaxID=38313 RepID=UPI001AB009CF|nr:hypothetical protein [Shewanella algae]MBO2583474.1 hypothetical protein [Shewanella algae]HEW9976968.1 hypothetical protein [Shewanella algae]